MGDQTVNTEIRLIIFFAAKDGEALYSQQKQDQELTVAQTMRRGSQGASRAAPGKSGLHARGEGERVLALESREGTRASRRMV